MRTTGTVRFNVIFVDFPDVSAGNTTTQLISVNVSAVADIIADSLSTTEDTPISANVITMISRFISGW